MCGNADKGKKFASEMSFNLMHSALSWRWTFLLGDDRLCIFFFKTAKATIDDRLH